MTDLDDFEPIPGFPGYFASRDGRIATEMPFGNSSQPGPRRERRLSRHRGHGYLYVTLRKDRIAITRQVHHLICRTFHGSPRPGQEVRHLDGNQLNNRADNLRWGSHAENVIDSLRHMRHAKQKLTIEQVIDIRARCEEGERPADLAREFGVTPSLVSQIKHRKAWSHV